MFCFPRRNALCCTTVLVLLALRLLTPAGYMPASAGSGLLFELCPDGLPITVVDAFAGGAHHHHHRNGQGSGDDSKPGSVIDQCPVGHMLSASIAIEDTSALQWPPAPTSVHRVPVRPLQLVNRTQYHSRGPPA